MTEIQGIYNIGNSCYVASLIQCLRDCLSSYPYELSLLDMYIDGNEEEGIKSIWECVDGSMNDPHELYMNFMEILPTIVSRHFMIEYEGGVKMPHLPITTSLENGGDSIKDAPNIICVYRVPSQNRVSDFSTLEIDISNKSDTITNRYVMRSCICYTHGSNGKSALLWHGDQPIRQGVDHYFALVLRDDIWMKCDDSQIYPVDHKRLKFPIYMIFYIKQ